MATIPCTCRLVPASVLKVGWSNARSAQPVCSRQCRAGTAGAAERGTAHRRSGGWEPQRHHEMVGYPRPEATQRAPAQGGGCRIAATGWGKSRKSAKSLTVCTWYQRQPATVANVRQKYRAEVEGPGCGETGTLWSMTQGQSCWLSPVSLDLRRKIVTELGIAAEDLGLSSGQARRLVSRDDASPEIAASRLRWPNEPSVGFGTEPVTANPAFPERPFQRAV